MRILTPFLLFTLVVIPVHAQSEDGFFSVSQEVFAPSEAVEAEASELAAEKDYLDREVVPVQFPAALAGDFFLQIEGVAFTLHLRVMNRLTEVVLQSRQRSISAEAKEAAEAFLKDLAERARVNYR